MSCRELERLFASGAPDAALRGHRASCGPCEALARDVEAGEEMLSGLVAPVWSAALRDGLLAVPRVAVSCEAADGMIARALENEVSPEERRRLDSHLSRCEGCSASWATLFGMRELAKPQPAPWFAGRVAARRPAPRRSGWRGLLDPRAAIAVAYAAAVVAMLLGFNPADLARKANVASVERGAQAAVLAAKSSLVDRIGAYEERAVRALIAFKGKAGGYGRAALSNVLTLVMKRESQPPPTPRNGTEKGVLQKNETEIWTWRA